jgi:hypothetical protein
MEAATPLRPPSVRSLPGERVAVDGLVLDDATLARLVREREEREEDAVGLVVDAIEIGARVLDREQAGANAEWIKAEMEKAARELDQEFVDRARSLGEELDGRLGQFLSPEGVLAKSLERLFSDGSSEAVQHRVRELVAETMAQARADLVRQFSSADDSNPLADLKRNTVNALTEAAKLQDGHLRTLHAELATVKQELQGLRDDREKQLELAEAEEAGTRKGRTYEEAVYEALDEIAHAHGDTAEAVGDVKEATGKVGDVVVGIDACAGPGRGRVVFEAKNSQLSRPKALRELDEALAERNADFAVLVVAGEEKVPARMVPLREYNGDKLIVSYDPQEGSRLALEVGYALARARVLMTRGEGDSLDAAALRDTIERAVIAMEDVRKIKLQLTGASDGIRNARELLEAMAETVRGHLAQIDGLLAGQ